MATLELEPVTRTKRTEAEVDAALTAVALSDGHIKRGHERLAAAGIHMPYDTLKTWVRETFPNRYQAAAEKYAPQIERSIITQLRHGARRSFEIAQEAAELERARIRAGTVKDPAASARNLATTGAIMVDKMLLLDGRPTQVTEHRTMDDVIRGLRDAGAVIDATCVETV